MSSAIAAAVPKTDIPAWVLAAAFPSDGVRSRVPVIVEIPGDRLLSKHSQPVMNVDVFVYAVDRAGTTQDSLYQNIGLDLTKVKRDASEGWHQVLQPALPARRRLHAAVLVRDGETGRFGVTVNALAVPESTAPFALPPLFVDPGRQWIMVKARPRAAEEEKAEYPFAIGGESFIPAALAGVKSGETTQVCLMAYNFDVSETPLAYSGRVLGVDGKPHGKVEPRARQGLGEGGAAGRPKDHAALPPFGARSGALRPGGQASGLPERKVDGVVVPVRRGVRAQTSS